MLMFYFFRELVLLYVKGAIRKDWPSVIFILQTNGEAQLAMLMSGFDLFSHLPLRASAH